MPRLGMPDAPSTVKHGILKARRLGHGVLPAFRGGYFLYLVLLASRREAVMSAQDRNDTRRAK
jgi:hypothetical protein